MSPTSVPETVFSTGAQPITFVPLLSVPLIRAFFMLEYCSAKYMETLLQGGEGAGWDLYMWEGGYSPFIGKECWPPIAHDPRALSVFREFQFCSPFLRRKMYQSKSVNSDNVHAS